jgi:hypothetical protein
MSSGHWDSLLGVFLVSGRASAAECVVVWQLEQHPIEIETRQQTNLDFIFEFDTLYNQSIQEKDRVVYEQRKDKSYSYNKDIPT